MRIRIALFTIVFCLLAVSWAFPQAENQGPGHRGRDPIEIDQQKAMEKARNESRQKDLKRDTVRLLELATELKQYVDRTNESVLSLEVIKKTEEIEKLAKSIKNKMKGP